MTQVDDIYFNILNPKNIFYLIDNKVIYHREAGAKYRDLIIPTISRSRLDLDQYYVIKDNIRMKLDEKSLSDDTLLVDKSGLPVGLWANWRQFYRFDQVGKIFKVSGDHELLEFPEIEYKPITREAKAAVYAMKQNSNINNILDWNAFDYLAFYTVRHLLD